MKHDFRKDFDWSNVTNPMTDEQAKVWTAALRSGDYAQSTGQLETKPDDAGSRKPAGFCCLGVANKALDYGLGSHCAVLKDYEQGNDPLEYIGLPKEIQIILYSMNDSRGKSFAEIADFIDEGFGLV